MSNVGKIAELLAAGFALRFERSAKGRRRLHEHCDVVWESIDRKSLYTTLDRLALAGVVEVVRNANHTEHVRLTRKGKRKVLQAHLDALALPTKKRWDNVWRMVIYDVPEKKKSARNALQRKLKSLGMLEFQRSVFIYPYACRDEINFVINFFDIEDCVYYVEARVQPDREIRKHFGV